MVCNFTLIVYHMSCTAQDWGLIESPYTAAMMDAQYKVPHRPIDASANQA
jgi:hypothetical protein